MGPIAGMILKALLSSGARTAATTGAKQAALTASKGNARKTIAEVLSEVPATAAKPTSGNALSLFRGVGGEQSGGAALGRGLYATSNRDLARLFGSVQRVKAAPKQLLKLDDPDDFANAYNRIYIELTAKQAARASQSGFGASPLPYNQGYSQLKSLYSSAHNVPRSQAPDMINARLQQAGYDGLRYSAKDAVPGGVTGNYPGYAYLLWGGM